MRSIVITGVSTGIGHATAKLLLERGFAVFGSVRKQADADRLKQEFGAHFTPLVFDVTDEAAVRAAAEQVRAALGGETLAGLVNNAGIAVSGAVLDLPASEFRRQFEVNVIGPILATQAFGPLLGTEPGLRGPKGRIVMMSSLAGKFGNPLMAAYSASKHALEGLSDGLRRELMLFGIDLIILAPGAVKTPIWAKAEQEDISAFSASPFYPALQEGLCDAAAARRQRPAGGDHRRSGARGADRRQAEGAAHADAVAAAQHHHVRAAASGDRQDRREPAGADPADRQVTAPCARCLSRLIAVAAIGLVSSATLAAEEADKEPSCDGSTYQIVECQKARLARLDQRLNAAYQQALKDALAGPARAAARSRSGCGCSTATPIACSTTRARGRSPGSKPAAACSA